MNAVLQEHVRQIEAHRETERTLRKLRSEYVKPMTEDHLAIDTYNPAGLLDALIVRLNLKNDAALAVALEVAPPAVSKLRNRKSSLVASILLRVHDVSGLPANELRRLAGVV